jgi:hypothetical protein
MAVAATTTELREAMLAQRIVRVQPLPVDVCQWIVGETPHSTADRVALLGNLVDRIAAANSNPYPYLTISSLAAILPFYEPRPHDDQAQQLRRSLHSLCGLLAMTNLRVVIEEEWNVLAAAAQQQAWLPEYFAAEYLTVDFPCWTNELAERSLAVLAQRFSDAAGERRFEIEHSDWDRNFRIAERLLGSDGARQVPELCSHLGNNQRSAFVALLERARTNMDCESRLALNRETAATDTSEPKTDRIVLNSTLAENLRSSPTSLPKLPLSATHPAIEDYFPSTDHEQLRVALDALLTEARNAEVPVNMVVINELKANDTAPAHRDAQLEIQNSKPRIWLEQVCNELMEPHDDREFARLYSIRSGELIFIQGGGDRLKLMPWIRSVLDGCSTSLGVEQVSIDGEAEKVPNGLVAGLASVGRPNKSFRSTTLLQAAVRCLEAAKHQGAGSIKSIEVF